MDHTFTTFAAAYRAAFRGLMQYAPNEYGSIVYAEQMAALADEYPAWADAVEACEDRPCACGATGCVQCDDAFTEGS